MAKIVIEVPDSMQDMCRWHKDGINELTGIEVGILAEAVAKGTVLKHGVWVGVDEEPHEDWECSCCGYVVYANENIEEVHYCPNCGAKMAESEG